MVSPSLRVLVAISQQSQRKYRTVLWSYIRRETFLNPIHRHTSCPPPPAGASQYQIGLPATYIYINNHKKPQFLNGRDPRVNNSGIGPLDPHHLPASYSLAILVYPPLPQGPSQVSHIFPIVPIPPPGPSRYPFPWVIFPLTLELFGKLDIRRRRRSGPLQQLVTLRLCAFPQSGQ